VNRRAAVRSLVVGGAGSFFDRLFAGGKGDEQPSYTIHSEVRLVLLDVSVKSRGGGFVNGLSKDNFEVFEDGRSQRITVFDHNDLPVTAGILVDESRSMTPKRADVITAAETFIEESNPQDEIFVLNFNERVMPGLPGDMPFSGDLEQLRSALYRGVPQGRTALNDAVLSGLKQLELGHRDKKALILISDGGDNASEHNRREVLDMIERSIATVYTIGLFEPDDPDRDPGILRQLARISGGDAYFPEKPSEMVPVCRGIAKDIRTRYTIGYHPEDDKGRSSLRHIRVQVSAPGHGRIITRTRSSYRYDATKDQDAAKDQKEQ
jgi:Ca-activated chloride channel family protein